MSEIEDAAEEKRLAYMKSKREYADALRVRSETERLNPSMVKGERAKPSLGERLKKQTDDMIEAKHAYDLSQNMFGNGNNGHRGGWTNEQALGYARYLASLNKSPEEIEKHIQKLGAVLDMAASPQYLNPFFQNTLMASTAERERFGVREFSEVVQMVSNIQKPSNGSDTAAIIAALGSFLTATNKGNGNNGEIVALYGQMSQQQQASFDRHLELLRERYSDQPSFSDQLSQILQVQNTLGKLSGKESDAILGKRLDLDFQKWQKQAELDGEARKSKNQTELVKTITGNLQKAFESPVVRELGRNVGKKLGVGENPLSQARSAAAIQQLENPMAAMWGLTCMKCKQSKQFSVLQMEKIKQAGGKWVCDTPGCGEVYQLKRDGEQADE